jgi:alanyl-tRNA synthetase
MASRPTSETSSRSSTSSESGYAEVRAHSAVHILKGAVTNVLGPRRFAASPAGQLRVRAEAAPTRQEVSKIEVASNNKIAEDAEFLEFGMERQEAEGHFGEGLFDLSPAPEDGALLKIVKIEDWDVSCCSRKHVESAGSIGAIRIEGADWDDGLKVVTLRFRLV